MQGRFTKDISIPFPGPPTMAETSEVLKTSEVFGE